MYNYDYYNRHNSTYTAHHTSTTEGHFTVSAKVFNESGRRRKTKD